MAARNNGKLIWVIWLLVSLALGGLIYAALASIASERVDPLGLQLRSLIVPGKTTHGHHQIELVCEACHTRAFGDKDDIQASCENCHAAGLRAARDSHPRAKFRDPANFARLEIIDAMYCVTCHVEHKPDITLAGGLTMQQDFCVLCHQDIASSRPSHAGMEFSTCANSGCHSYHDNLSLRENFLLEHAQGGFLLDRTVVPKRNLLVILEEDWEYPHDRYPLEPLAAADADHGAMLRSDERIAAEWLASSHAQAGVNCSACHEIRDRDEHAAWIERPSETTCASCHGLEVERFLSGLHGLRLRTKLGPMRPAQARQPMKDDAAHLQLGCTSCHGAHRFETRRAAVDGCLGCHDDEHSRNYRASVHFELWQRELAGDAPAGSGVSCASCHLPRIEHVGEDFSRRILVQHNQNANLYPQTKMARTVCLNCHGLGFALDALSDAALMRRNFQGRPTKAVPSIEMAREREQTLARERGR